MHINDLEILYSLKHFFGVGTVLIDKTGAHYLVTGIYSPKKKLDWFIQISKSIRNFAIYFLQF